MAVTKLKEGRFPLDESLAESASAYLSLTATEANPLLLVDFAYWQVFWGTISCDS
jgi:hypothetical protein